MTNDPSPDIAAIIVAAGRSERMGGADKLWTPVADRSGRARPLVAYSIAAFQRCAAVRRVALVVAHDALERARASFGEGRADNVCAVVPGGPRRQDSVRAGLDALGACDLIVVHDGARPLVTPELIERGIEAAQDTGASCCSLPIAETVKEADDGFVSRTLDRSRLWLAQTPQVFRYDLLRRAHEMPQSDATDDASMVEALDVRVRLYEGARSNMKVTTAEDLAIVEALLRRS